MTHTKRPCLKTIDEHLRQQASQVYPHHRFEDIRYFGPVVLGLTMGLQQVFLSVFDPMPPRWISMSVLVVYWGATALDAYATHLDMCLKPAFEAKGYELPIRESHLLMPDHPTLKQNVLSWPSLFSLLGSFIVFYVPAVGMGASLLHLFTAWRNDRMRRRMLLQLELIKS